MSDLGFYLYMVFSTPLIVLFISFITWENAVKALGIKYIIRLEALLVSFALIYACIKHFHA
ncbi:hypothetical protein SAMN05216522_12121 [Rosenbergiella nectarea]|uniref:Uncharacterized protein n=1 Tax=Rosenbergiella nectarea TaxID=988801 RepID=A0A1H9N243_9GAMM|nr:hypothetical protein [Rosenbergiella nectarea]SER29968.1 hypothetical protein SAMN05216522_12121 [Rosenbergiella nectarea]